MNTKQLRLRILDRAIRGKLVPQAPTDEPASVLLERIRREKEELIKDKKLKREKRDIQPIEEVPFEIPEGWVWCRLGEVCDINPKNKLDDELEVSFIPMPLISDGFSNTHSFEVKKWNDIKKGYTHFCNGDIGVAKITPCFENRKSVIFNDLKNGVGAGTTEIYILRSNLAFNKYLFWVVKTQEFINKGIESFTGAVGQQRVSKDFIENSFIPLPPLAEQHRIVQKIEQLFALVDIIEVNKKALEKLIEQAKSQVLSDAIAGKLTRQDPNNEPAEELLKRIGKTTAFDTPYEKLPKGWAWCRGNQILNPMESQKPLGEKFDYIDISSIDNRQNKITEIKTIAVTEAPSRASRKVKFGDTLFSMVRPYLRNIAFVDKKYSNCIASTGFYVCTPNKTLFPKYLFYLMMSDYVVQGLNKYMKGDNSPSINNEDITNFIFPLPPIKEQPHIVQKIENYFFFFDTIESNL